MKKQRKNQNEVASAPVTSEKILTPIQEKRMNLRKLSLQVRQLVTDGIHKTINSAIIKTVYSNDVHKTFKSFDQWKADGFRIKKGEKAFPIWAAPVDAPTEEDQNGKFFPIRFIFSNAQVEPMKKEAQA